MIIEPEDLEGATIKKVRHMNFSEMAAFGWSEYEDHKDGRPVVIILDDGRKLIPSRDPEKNGPGDIIGYKDGESFWVRRGG